MKEKETSGTIKAVVFDFGGVIALSSGSIIEEIRTIIGAPSEEFKKVYFEHNHLANVGNMPWEEMIMKVIAVFDKDLTHELEVREAVRRYRLGKTINKELVSFFEPLRKQGYKVAILSNAMSSLREELEREGLDKLVDEVVISGEIGYQKPHKEAFQVLFERLGLDPHQLIFIDDAPKSLEKAKEIGYIPILFKNNKQLKAELEKYGVSVAG